MKENSSKKLEKTYFDVLGLCCSSEVPLIDKILRPIEGVYDFSVIVPSRTVIVIHDPLLVSSLQIGKVTLFVIYLFTLLVFHYLTR
ncbi:putative translocase [Helianthus annuus]|nr:putative translocase [Helianthus annuus]